MNGDFVLTREQVRDVDRIAIDEYGMSGLVLMENAGRGAAEIVHQEAPPGPIAILCGSGNNGGDGYVIARHLELLGRAVSVISVVPLNALSGDARANAQIAVLGKIPFREIERKEEFAEALDSVGTIIDCLLGTGAIGAPRKLYAEAIRGANAKSAFRVAIDVPSGLDCDRGEPQEPTFRAHQTVSFVASKPGLGGSAAAPYVGTLHVVAIGVPKALLERVSSAARR